MLTLKTPQDLQALIAQGQSITFDSTAHLMQVAPFFSSVDIPKERGSVTHLPSLKWGVAGVFDLVMGNVTPLTTAFFWKSQNLTILWDDPLKTWGKDFKPILERLGVLECDFVKPGEKPLVKPGDDRFKKSDLAMLLATLRSIEATAKDPVYPELLAGFIEARRAYLRQCVRRIKKNVPYTRVMLAHTADGIKTEADLNRFYSARFAWVHDADGLAAIAETVDNAPWVADLYSLWFICKELYTLKKLGLTLLKEPTAARDDSYIRLLAFALIGGRRAKKAEADNPVIKPTPEENRQALLDQYNASILDEPVRVASVSAARAVPVAETEEEYDFGLPDESTSPDDFDFEAADDVPVVFDF